MSSENPQNSQFAEGWQLLFHGNIICSKHFLKTVDWIIPKLGTALHMILGYNNSILLLVLSPKITSDNLETRKNEGNLTIFMWGRPTIAGVRYCLGPLVMSCHGICHVICRVMSCVMWRHIAHFMTHVITDMTWHNYYMTDMTRDLTWLTWHDMTWLDRHDMTYDSWMVFMFWVELWSWIIIRICLLVCTALAKFRCFCVDNKLGLVCLF